jgi:predicted SAM-dependent methyltransferase
MKVHLTKTKESAIKGYTEILYSQASKLNNLATLSDNECEFILAGDVLDDFSRQEIFDVIQSLAKKLRMNGTLVVGGTDIRVFCKNVINSTLSENDASEIIKSKQSMTNLQETLDLLKGIGLKIQSSRIIGTHYEITAVRN